jgi:cytochrome c-type biogenesis protein CcmF
LLEDLYLTLVATPGDDGRVTLGVAVNPLVLWLWVGGAVMAVGTLVALSPRRRERVVAAVAVEEHERVAAAESPEIPEPEPVGEPVS